MVTNILFASFLISLLSPGWAQFFNPHMNDAVYLDTIEATVRAEVMGAKEDMMYEAETLKNLTELYIGAKLRENLYKAMRKEAGMKEERRLPMFNIIKSSVRDGPMYSSKFTKQFDNDYPEIAEEGSDVLNFAVKLNGLVLKQLLLVPHFFRDTIKKIFPNVSINATETRLEKVKEKQDMLEKLAVNAETFLNRSSDIQVLGVLSLVAQGADVNVTDSEGNKTWTAVISNQMVDEKDSRVSSLARQIVVDDDQGSHDDSSDIYIGTHTAYTILDNLRSAINALM